MCFFALLLLVSSALLQVTSNVPEDKDRDRYRLALPGSTGPNADDRRSVRQLPGYATGQLSSKRLHVTFMNKAGRRVSLFQSNPDGSEVMFQFLLKPNEPRTVSFERDGSFWEVYDQATNKLLLMNGHQRLESTRMLPGRMLNARIHSNSLPPDPVPKGRLAPRFIEVFVVLDHSMFLHHGSGLEKYAYALMNTVARAYTHRSLKIPIFIALTGMVTMETRPEYYSIVKDEPDISVRSACRFAWSHSANYSFDFALIITREDIGPEGYASMYTMCTNRSCALVKESNPDSAFVIVHEIAHALGIDHDEDDSCARDNVAGGNIMVKKIYTTSANKQWSRCSRKMLLQNLKYMPCLDNKPAIMPSFRKALLDLPGENFDMNEQCRKHHGERAVRCDKSIVTGCRYLWCRKHSGESCQPLWWHTPYDGTECADGRWCIRGRCIKKRKKYPVDGSWSKWSEFYPKCNASVLTWIIQKRNRSCTNPRPKNGGKKCTGEKEEYRVMLPPDGSGDCIPYSFTALVLSPNVNLEAMRTEVCELSDHKNVKWKEYLVGEQKRYMRKFQFSCDFEKKGCSWRSSEQGAKPWSIGRGKTPSVNTGPEFDHTYKDANGHYLFFEASWSEETKMLMSGDRAILKSPLIVSPHVCLRFAYHMYGEHVRGLEVILHNGRHKRKMWSKYKNQGEKWHVAEINLSINVEYHITIEAIRGQSYYSDVAIDDIQITHGKCKKTQLKKNVCTSICVNDDKTMMYRQQQNDGTPCGTVGVSTNAVCFKKKCQPVNCLGIIGKSNC